ncbi:hypothetical protein [Methanocella arvoryzae]|uniref:Uncharacterized protein n=1 Tax=Methanocella arvoryzae (strain DSM 22066 / NBRC 105507 / MRE50) TaxID=351160 RepID=Q0W401_METAR|nr:hypothetical protein [Methanocella arvoryzae]CAJ36892.1 hypothetical protein RCIX1662 [Methanocella arvoryzae MRE50]
MDRFVESPEGQELAVLCLDYGYKLADRPADLTRPQVSFLVAALVDRLEKEAAVRSEEAGVNRIIFTDDDVDTE